MALVTTFCGDFPKLQAARHIPVRALLPCPPCPGGLKGRSEPREEVVGLLVRGPGVPE